MADFFPPVVDDTYSFGAVAAVNAMSDIYAMGGEVAVALNVCAFPGDHTVDDKEPKYGLSVMGFAHPDSIMTKADVRPGDKIVITKPPGTVIITTAGKKKLAYQQNIRFAGSIEEGLRRLMFTPETSGGLLAAVPSEQIEKVLGEFEKAGALCRVIGETVEGRGLEVLP